VPRPYENEEGPVFSVVNIFTPGAHNSISGPQPDFSQRISFSSVAPTAITGPQRAGYCTPTLGLLPALAAKNRFNLYAKPHPSLKACVPQYRIPWGAPKLILIISA
jgi:hypothetical protein